MFACTFYHFLALTTTALYAVAAPGGKGCTGNIASLDDVADAIACTTININSLTVPAGILFNLTLQTGTTVNMSTCGFFLLHFSTHLCPLMVGSGRCYLWEQNVGWTPFPSQVTVTSRSSIPVDVTSNSGRALQWKRHHM